MQAVFKGQTVTNRNEDRLDIGAGSQNLTDDLCVVNQVANRSTLSTWLPVLAAQPGLSNSDRRMPQPETQMGGNSQASWMSSSMPVNKNQIWKHRQLVERPHPGLR